MTKSLNTAPYYDDFSSDKNFHQIVFRPGYAVQARELTQIQSILRDQIAKFGNHIFQQGSIVIPGNSFYDLSAQYVCLESTSTDPNNFIGLTLKGETSGVVGVVKSVVSATASSPITFYVSYTSGGNVVDNATYTKFLDGETIRTRDTTVSAVLSSTSATGAGSIAYVNAGVYYVNGSFVHVDSQSTIMSSYTSSPSCRVVFKITEELITSDSDESLLDPAQGSYNFAAPGADRLKISLELTTITLDAPITDDYIELMKFDLGVLKSHSRYPKYSELEKTLARRTFDESGNYIAYGMSSNVREHNRTLVNGGVVNNGDINKMVVELSSGKAYVEGHEIETIYTQQAVIDKARDIDHISITSTNLTVTYGQYIYVYAPRGSLDIANSPEITLYSDAAGTTSVGTATAIALDYFTGDGTHPIYKLYITNVDISVALDAVAVIKQSTFFQAILITEFTTPIVGAGFVHDDIIDFASGNRSAKVALYSNVTGKTYVYRHSADFVPVIGDQVIGSLSNGVSVVSGKANTIINNNNGRIIRLPSIATKSLKNAIPAYDLFYTTWVKLTIPIGSSTVSIASGTFVPIETGTFIALNSSGLDSSAYIITGGNTINRNSGNTLDTISIYCQINYTNASPRTKISTDATETKVSTKIVYLNNTDAYKVTSIINNGVELLNNYTLESGATDFEYGYSYIVLKDGITVPTGNLVISYSYYSHSPGDFFTVDSYPLASEYIPHYQSKTTGVLYSLRDCIDFRSSVSSSTNPIVVDTIITTSIQRYVPRIDIVCINPSGELIVVKGTPALEPKYPVVNNNYYKIASFYIPAYTYSIKDVKKKNIAVQRYTMSGVNGINTRVKNLEQYSMLSSAELGILNTPYIDAETGLDKFRTGYFVESMSNAYTMAETSTGFNATLNTRGIYANVEDTAIQMIVSSASGLSLVGGVYMLPYTEVVHSQVVVASRTTNLNPFEVITWNGKLIMNPPSDIWSETFYLDQLVKNETVSITTDVEVDVAGDVIVIPCRPPIINNTYNNSYTTYYSGGYFGVAESDALSGLIGLNDGWGTLGYESDALSGLIGLNDGWGTLGGGYDNGGISQNSDRDDGGWGGGSGGWGSGPGSGGDSSSSDSGSSSSGSDSGSGHGGGGSDPG